MRLPCQNAITRSLGRLFRERISVTCKFDHSYLRARCEGQVVGMPSATLKKMNTQFNTSMLEFQEALSLSVSLSLCIYTHVVSLSHCLKVKLSGVLSLQSQSHGWQKIHRYSGHGRLEPTHSQLRRPAALFTAGRKPART